jgi:hypothetical protein
LIALRRHPAEEKQFEYANEMTGCCRLLICGTAAGGVMAPASRSLRPFDFGEKCPSPVTGCPASHGVHVIHLIRIFPFDIDPVPFKFQVSRPSNFIQNRRNFFSEVFW